MAREGLWRMSLDAATVQLEAEIALIAGRRPAQGTPQWFLLQVKSLGLSTLKSAKVRGLVDAQGFDLYRRQCRATFIDLPPDAPSE